MASAGNKKNSQSKRNQPSGNGRTTLASQLALQLSALPAQQVDAPQVENNLNGQYYLLK